MNQRTLRIKMMDGELIKIPLPDDKNATCAIDTNLMCAVLNVGYTNEVCFRLSEVKYWFVEKNTETNQE